MLTNEELTTTAIHLELVNAPFELDSKLVDQLKATCIHCVNVH